MAAKVAPTKAPAGRGPVRVNREDLLHRLESVAPGLAQRDIVEQSKCFIFAGGLVRTFNDELAGTHQSPLPAGFVGAVEAEPLLALLGKLQEEDLELTQGEEELEVRGARRRAGIRMEREVKLRLDVVDEPGPWAKLPEDFLEALGTVRRCSSTDESQLFKTCVHLHPKWVEACDDTQLCRWKVKSPLSAPTLMRQSSVQHVVSLGLTEVAESPGWLHFRNGHGLTLACRRYAEEYPDMAAALQVTGGEKLVLPKGMAEVVEKAEIFSAEDPDNNYVTVKLKPGAITVQGKGARGWFRETKKLAYRGGPLEFRVAPALLADLAGRHNECLVTPTRLKVDTGSYVYVSELTPAAEGA